MKTITYIWQWLFFCCFILPVQAQTSDSTTTVFRFSGQISGWIQGTPDTDVKAWVGGRYIPQANYEINFPGEHKLDFEASANMYGDIGFRKFNDSHADGDIDPYRLWVRYSSAQMEVRLGLQKINFGSAQIFRPLMWFDSMDARDPLQMTTGVWGGLFRYYFRNNANIWLWTLAGNKDAKGWEIARTSGQLRPEAGGRLQYPLSFGEVALSYHYRRASFGYLLSGTVPPDLLLNDIPENRIGFDIRADVEIGLWLEASWTHYAKDVGIFTNQELITLGTDYTFGIGNGLAATAEHLIYGTDRNPFRFRNTINFSGVSLSYPLTMIDDISAMVYYDWKNGKLYTFANWQKKYNHITVYLMGYWNPKQNELPGQMTSNRFAGKGLQLMVVWDY